MQKLCEEEEERVRELSVLPVQFLCKLKTALKYDLLIKTTVSPEK